MKRGIDHLVLCVSDLDAAAAFYRRLGFTTTPRAQHPWGTDNSLVQLNNCFLELLTVARPALITAVSKKRFSFGAYNQQFLSQREGMSMLVFESTDALADREEFISRGLPAYENFHFERSTTLPDGSQARVAFTMAFVTDPRLPEAAFFCCQHHVPEHFWKSEYQSHVNGANTVHEVIMVAEDPPMLADFFSKIQEPASVTTRDSRLTVSTPRGRIVVITPSDAHHCYGNLNLSGFPRSPFFLGFVIRVPELDRVATHLLANLAPFETSSDSIRVTPDNAFGVLIEFRQ
ncbi:MAG: VOC family protein [Acidiferrobacterales bacterium]